MFRSRNHLPRSPSRLPLRLPGFARTAPSKQQGSPPQQPNLQRRSQDSQLEVTEPGRAELVQYLVCTAHGHQPQTPLNSFLQARCSSNGQRRASQQQPIQSAAGGAGCSPNSQTSRTKVPGRGRGLSWPRSTAGARLADGARPGLACSRGSAFGATTGRPAGQLGGGRGWWERDCCCRCWSRSWSWSWSWSWECAQKRRTALHPLNFLRSSVVLGPKGAILAQPLPSPSLPSPSLPSPPLHSPP